MKGLVLLMILGLVLSLKAEVEVRAYLASERDFARVMKEDRERIPNHEILPRYRGASIEEAPFESRFFKEGDVLLDFTSWATGVGIFADGEGEAVYHKESGRLVVKAELRHHYLLEDYLEQFLVWQFRAELRVLKLPGVVLGRRDLSVVEIAKGEEIARLSGLVIPGQRAVFHSPESKLSWEVEGQSWFNDSSWDCRFEMKSKLPGAVIDLNSSLVGMMGVPTLVELGSMDGKETLAASVSLKMVLPDGSDFDDWVEAEKGDDVVMERRLREVRHKDRKWVDLKNGKRYQTFPVPPTFWNFISGGNSEGRSIKKVLGEQGIGLEENDSVVWVAGGNLLAVTASPLNLELLEGITMAVGSSSPPPVLGGSYALVESAEKIVDLRNPRLKILRKICAHGLPGQVPKLKMWGKFPEVFEVKFEGQSSGSDDFVESRATIRSKGKRVLKSRLDAGVGVPVILKQEKVGDRWRAWVGVLSARYVEAMIEEGR